ncbi:MAG: M61 family metallopeptidase [Bacteroidia bacterium]|nr:M61 family metallopeptidase [Bacteroidia bacterium]
MIKYKLFQKNPASHYIYVDLHIDNIKSDTLELQLPAWRPGRYELGNFAKNIKRVDAFDTKENVLEFTKTTKDCWLIKTKGVSEVKITYSYFANELNAGACFADETQIYVNPVHLCMYVPNRMNEEHTLELDIPDNYKIACQLKSDKRKLVTKNFDELADSPFMASANIQTDFYEVDGVNYYLHFNGECKPDFEKIKKHFKAFTEVQLKFWGGIPVDEYHFIFQVLPFKFYHGVEHQKSTVVVLGPGYNLNEGKTYEDLLGVSSHELFHTWNVKYIRPTEMLPYDFTKENYCKTGYVYEGFTTYYGDVMLRTSNVFTDEQYFETLEERLQKHFHNYGRFNLSVADSSWETWLDGYVPGAPYRKTSIYDEGNLVAFMLDILILKNTGNKKSLRDVCRILYNEFGKKNKGYSETDIVKLCEDAAGISLADFFKKFVYGTEDFEPMLNQCFDYVGIEMQKKLSNFKSESDFGFKVAEQAHISKVTLVAPYSPAWKAGLSIGDEIMTVNAKDIKNDLNNWLKYFSNAEIALTVSSQGRVKTLIMNVKQGLSYFDSYKLVFNTSASAQQKANYSKWLLEN